MARGGHDIGPGSPLRTRGEHQHQRRRWPTLVACLALLAWLSGGLLAGPVRAQADPFEATSATVNVELVLDVSGSMGELLPGTDQTRMEAAQEALLTVIGQIPERPGLNVGLRIYGQAGSNLEADQAVSCASTQLVVPVSAVNRAALSGAVQSAQPNGWTPLAKALQDASLDFQAGESITNAVIMVTDGEETCGGDPCAVAGALHAEGIALTTHVVGFALTPQQTESVRCIAEQGGGQLFAAADTASLSDAVFSAFEQIDVPAVAGGVVVGNAFDVLGPGTPGVLSVVAAGMEDETLLMLVIHNGTETTVENIGADVVARRGETTVGSGTTYISAPYVVPPGGVAFIEIYFPDGELTATDDFDITITFDALGTTLPPLRSVDLMIDSIQGTDFGLEIVQRNPYEFDANPNQSQSAICFDAAGTPHHYLFDTTVVTRLPAGAGAPELIADYRGDECPYYLAAAAGDAEVDFDELTTPPEASLAPAPALPDAPANAAPNAISGAPAPAPTTAPALAPSSPAPASSQPAPGGSPSNPPPSGSTTGGTGGGNAGTSTGATTSNPGTTSPGSGSGSSGGGAAGAPANAPGTGQTASAPAPAPAANPASTLTTAPDLDAVPAANSGANTAPDAGANAASGAGTTAPAASGGIGAAVGPALAVITPGEPGALSAVAGDIAGDDTVLLVLRNNTGAPVENVQVVAMAQIGGELVSGATVHVAPYEVPDGAVAIAEVFFSPGGLTNATPLTLDVTADPAGTTPPRDRLATDLTVEDVALSAVGAEVTVRNPHDFAIGPNQYLYLMCFDANGQPDHLAFDTEPLSDIPAGGSAQLTLADPSVAACASNYVLVVTGDPRR